MDDTRHVKKIADGEIQKSLGVIDAYCRSLTTHMEHTQSLLKLAQLGQCQAEIQHDSLQHLLLTRLLILRMVRELEPYVTESIPKNGTDCLSASISYFPHSVDN